METIFYDINAAINHTLSFVGATSVKRKDNKTFAFSKFHPYTVFLSLMLEKGVKENARKELDLFYFQNNNLQSRLYLYGSPKSYCPVQPGQFIGFANGQYDDTKGLVIKVDEKGNPVQVLTLKKKKLLQLENKKIEISAIYESFDLSFTPRAWPQEPEMAAFYGDWSGLKSIIKDQSIGHFVLTYKLGGKTYDMIRYKMGDLLKFTILNSEYWIQERILKAGDKINNLEYVLNTLGAGIQIYTESSRVYLGYVVFTKGRNVGIVVNSDGNGNPTMIIAPSGDSYLYNAHQYFQKINTYEIEKYWVPTTQPYPYYEPINKPAFINVNGWIGKLKMLWRTYDYRYSLFKLPYILDTDFMDPKLIAILSSGPVKYNDWKNYLSLFGKGLQKPSDVKIEPGDFLFVKYSQSYNIAIAMDTKSMILIVYDEIKFPDITNVEYIWKPSVEKMID